MVLEETVEGAGTVITRLSEHALDELVEIARIATLRVEFCSRLTVFDRNAVLFTVDGSGRQLVDALDEWAVAAPPLCPECGEMLHAARVASVVGWCCAGCGYRAEAQQ
ncbi:hypothetical protein [Nocardia brasiliensis]|nr:hypothetical protein [Nocardia brasiliensis]